MQSVHLLRAAIASGIILVSAVVGFGAGAAQAATTFSGFTNGCFGASCLPAASASPQSATLGGLTYLNSTFSVTDAGGFAEIGNAPGTPNVNNLGSFTLTGAPFTGTAFDLRVTFTAPVAGTLIFTSTISGLVTALDNGGVFIEFNNTPGFIAFTGGSFGLVVYDVSMNAGNPVPLTGQIVSVITGVPEPETYAMILVGLGLMGFVARRKKQAA